MKALVCILLLLETFVFVVQQQVDGGLNENKDSQQISSEDGRQNPPQTDTLRAEASTDSQQNCILCFSDIHAALRELTATVTEQKAINRELTATVTEQKENIRELIATVTEQKTINRALEARLMDAEKAAEQHTLLLEGLNKKNYDREIAFSTSLLQSGSGDVGPFTSDITLIYRNVFTNIGNAYNPITGIFTAPVKGVYVFTFSVYAHGQSNAASAYLMKNEKHAIVAFAQQNQGALNSSKGVVLVLEVGDVVYVRLRPNGKIQDNGNNHNTFSGYILFPLK
ncbi:cerebellin-2-like isoform X2 [Chanodichthys erythropterus]|uniref:cerebellin-2-like isoform X2 n=1 Tax=Chanodichthys erythropterus TaxID=933992 RepID=UPI00351ED1E1